MRSPGKDVQNGDCGEEEAPSPPVLHAVEEFKAEIVERCRAGDRSIAQVAKDFNLVESAVRRWVEQAEIDSGQRNGLTSGDAPSTPDPPASTSPTATVLSNGSSIDRHSVLPVDRVCHRVRLEGAPTAQAGQTTTSPPTVEFAEGVTRGSAI